MFMAIASMGESFNPSAPTAHQLIKCINGCVHSGRLCFPYRRWISRLEPLFIFVPIDKLLRLWGFSDEFRYQMVFPLVRSVGSVM